MPCCIHLFRYQNTDANTIHVFLYKQTQRGGRGAVSIRAVTVHTRTNKKSFFLIFSSARTEKRGSISCEVFISKSGGRGAKKKKKSIFDGVGEVIEL